MRESCAWTLKLSRAHPAYRGNKFLHGLQNLETMTMKRAVVRFKGARKKESRGICGMPQGLASRHDGRPPVEGDLRQAPDTA